MMVYKKVSVSHLDRVKELLHSYDLPTEDLGSTKIDLFEALDKDMLVGCIGFEQYGNLALLRSLAVDGGHQGKGIGKELVNFLEMYLTENGVSELYLLTETAEVFFNNRGYQSIDRAFTPEALMVSAEISHLCPDSAVLMMKQL